MLPAPLRHPFPELGAQLRALRVLFPVTLAASFAALVLIVMFVRRAFEPYDLLIERAELAPGDALYVPRGVWHHVRTVADSLSTNCWWARGTRLPLVAAADLFKRLRGVNR